jgi:hypothetical protein
MVMLVGATLKTKDWLLTQYSLIFGRAKAEELYEACSYSLQGFGAFAKSTLDPQIDDSMPITLSDMLNHIMFSGQRATRARAV